MAVDNSTQDCEILKSVVQSLNAELANSREETQKAQDQIACLISLIKRSWQGDQTATTHIANIIGFHDQTYCQWNMKQKESRAVQNWERLSLKLLEREYARTEQEIKKRQDFYIRHRELYLDELQNTHDQYMDRIPLHRKTSTPSMEEIDNQFLMKQRAMSGKGSRVASAARLRQQRQLPKRLRDTVKPMDVQLSDFFIHNSPGMPGEVNPNVDKAMAGLLQTTKEGQGQKSDTTGMAYDDPHRYTKPSLFEVRNGTAPVERKARPVSAAVLRERNKLKTRPKSAVVPRPQPAERAIKYETTKPVTRPTKPKHPVPRLYLDETRSKFGPPTVTKEDGAATFIRNPYVSSASNGQRLRQKLDDSMDSWDEPPKPSITVRIRSATKRPEFVDKFEEEVQKMNDMEDQFRKTTLQLQKKLGIENHALVY